MPNLYSKAKAGDWARYSVVVTGSDATNFTGKLKVTVVSTGGGVATISELDENQGVSSKRTVNASGNMYDSILASLSKQAKDVKNKGFEGPVSEKVTAAGREFDCQRYTFKFTGRPPGGEAIQMEFTETWWISENAPLDGMVRLKRVYSGQAFGGKGERVEERALIEFGTSAAAPKSEPGTQPPAAVPSGTIPNYLKFAKKGDWAVYGFKESSTSGEAGKNALIRREVSDVRGGVVVLKVDDGYSGRKYDLPLSAASDPAEDIKRQFAVEGTGIAFGNFSSVTETVDAAGKNWQTTRYTLDFSGPGAAIQIRWWISPDAPLDGTVKEVLTFSRPAEPGSDVMQQLIQETTLTAFGRSK